MSLRLEPAASLTSKEHGTENDVADFLSQSVEPVVIPGSKDNNFRYIPQKIDIDSAIPGTSNSRKRKPGRPPNSGKKQRVSMKQKFPSVDTVKSL